MASVSVSGSVSSVSVVSVVVGWLIRLRTGGRSVRLSRAALLRLAQLEATAASAEGTPSADMPRCVTDEHGAKYFAQI